MPISAGEPIARDSAPQADLRRAERVALVMPGRCRTMGGGAEHVVIHDLSALGCRIASAGLLLRPGARVLVRPDCIEGIPGIVRWTTPESAGIEFERELYAPLVDHLHRTFRTFLHSTTAGLSAPPPRVAI